MGVNSRCWALNRFDLLLLLHRDNLHGLARLKDLPLNDSHRLHLHLLLRPLHLRLDDLHLLLWVLWVGRSRVTPVLLLLAREALLRLLALLQVLAAQHRGHDNAQHGDDATHRTGPVSTSSSARVVLTGAVHGRVRAPAAQAWSRYDLAELSFVG